MLDLPIGVDDLYQARVFLKELVCELERQLVGSSVVVVFLLLLISEVQGQERYLILIFK